MASNLTLFPFWCLPISKEISCCRQINIPGKKKQGKLANEFVCLSPKIGSMRCSQKRATSSLSCLYWRLLLGLVGIRLTACLAGHLPSFLAAFLPIPGQRRPSTVCHCQWECTVPDRCADNPGQGRRRKLPPGRMPVCVCCHRIRIRRGPVTLPWAPNLCNSRCHFRSSMTLSSHFHNEMMSLVRHSIETDESCSQFQTQSQGQIVSAHWGPETRGVLKDAEWMLIT